MKYIVVSDIHANRTALDAVIAAARLRLRQRQGSLRFWFLGDLVGYGPKEQVSSCLRWLRRESGIFNGNNSGCWTPGNHDEWIIRRIGKIHLDARVTMNAQRQLLLQPEQDEDWNWFTQEVRVGQENISAGLNWLRFDLEEKLRLAVAWAHGSIFGGRQNYMHPFEISKLSTELTKLYQDSDSETTLAMTGHTHMPFLVQLGSDGKARPLSIKYDRAIRLGPGAYAINPGSVGQPRDGDPRASFAILDTEAVSVEFCRAAYDIDLVIDELGKESNGTSDEEEKNAYRSLIKGLETGDGGENLNHYRHKVYRAPEADLIAIGEED